MGASPEGRNVGQVLSRREAKRLSRETGRSVAEVANRASEKGVGIGGRLGTQIGQAMNNPYGRDAQRLGIDATGFGGKSMEALEGLRGLQMQKGQAYYGSTTTTTPAATTGYKDSRSYTPASTTTTPIVLPRGYGRSQSGQPTDSATPSLTPMTPEQQQTRRDERIGQFTRRADRAQARSEMFAKRAERATRQDGTTKTREVVQRQRERSDRLKQKAQGMRANAERIRSRSAASQTSASTPA